MEEVIEIWDISDGTKQAAFICPGCDMYHAPLIEGPKIKGAGPWGFNGSLTKPTFSPSILVRWVSMPENPKKNEKGKYILGSDGRIQGAKDEICHSLVKEGRIQFLNDCTHKLKGQTVPLIPINTYNNERTKRK